jgi:hypothetical protein
VLFGSSDGAGIAEPRLVSTDLGHPAYGRLADGCPAEIRSGAEDGGEIGVFHGVNEQGRRAGLRATLDDALPSRISAAVIFID